MRSFLDIQKPEFTVVDEKTDAVLLPIAQQAAAERAARTLEQGVRLTGSLAELHGHCYGFEEERAKFEAPLLAVHSSAEARPGYNSMSACEYLNTPETLSAKARCLARLVAAAATPVYYCGAGLSTAAGMSDYASQVTRGSSLAGTGDTGALPAGLAAQLQAEQAARAEADRKLQEVRERLKSQQQRTQAVAAELKQQAPAPPPAKDNTSELQRLLAAPFDEHAELEPKCAPRSRCRCTCRPCVGHRSSTGPWLPRCSRLLIAGTIARRQRRSGARAASLSSADPPRRAALRAGPARVRARRGLRTPRRT